MKQRNILCSIAKQLYHHNTQLYLNCEIATELHRKMIHFLEFKEEGTDVECYKCESLISSNDSLSDAYKVGLEKVEEFLKSKDIK